MSKDQDPMLRQLLLALGSARSFAEVDGRLLGELSHRVRAASHHRARAANPSLPKRALALDALDVLRVPATPKMVEAIVRARTGADLDARALSTLRRDERAAWDREVAGGRPPAPKLAPALHHELVEPVRALVTSSAWELDRRFVTPHSPRADHPAAVLALLDEAFRLDDVDAEAAERVAALAARMSAGIPGASPFGTGPGARDALRRAAAEEHSRFATLAADERIAAARRASIVDSDARVWGRTSKIDRGRSSIGG